MFPTAYLTADPGTSHGITWKRTTQRCQDKIAILLPFRSIEIKSPALVSNCSKVILSLVSYYIQGFSATLNAIH